MFNNQAQWQLGRCYATGHGTKVKPEKAKALFQRASDQGHPKAKEELLRLPSDQKRDTASCLKAVEMVV